MSRYDKAKIAGILICTSLGFAEANGQTVRQIGVPESETKEAPANLENSVRSSETQAIWDLIGQQDWSGAQSLVDTLRQRVPEWTPPAQMNQLITAGRLQEQMDRAVINEDWPTVLRLVGPFSPNMCNREGHLWARFNALTGLELRDDLMSDLLAVLQQCESVELRSNLAKAYLPQFDPADTKQVFALIQSDPALRASLADLEQEANLRTDETLFQRQVASNAFTDAFATASRMSSRDAFMQLGWAARDTNTDLAQQAFSAANAIETATDSQIALALLENDTGNSARALDRLTALPITDLSAEQKDLVSSLALSHADDARLAGDLNKVQTLTALATHYNPAAAKAANDLVGATLLASAQTAYDSGQYSNAIAQAEQARQYASVERPARMLQAWSHYQSGDAAMAQAMFAELYQEAPDLNSADGLQVASTSSLHTRALADQIASADKTGLFRNAWRTQRALDAEAKGHFLTAYRLAPERDGAIEGVHRAWGFVGIGGRFQRGTDGADALDGYTARAAIGGTIGRHRLEAGAAFGNFDSGSGTPSDFITSPYIGWYREGDTQLSGKLGLSPIGGPTSTTVLGTAGLETNWNGVNFTGELKRVSRADSTLSLFGTETIDGTAFGRVIESGADISATLPLPRSFSVSLSGGGSVLDGVNTETNTRLKTRIDLNKSIKHPAFRYLSTGPFYQFDTYDNNANFFTIGHGGYFSPQAFHLTGWALNFETRETERWIVRGSTALSYENIREDAAPLNPLADGPQPLIGGNTTDGLSGTAKFEAAYQISPRLAIVSSASLIRSDAFQDVRTTFGIRFTPGGRRGLTRHDLSPSVANTDLWRR